MKNNDERLADVLGRLDKLSYVKLEKIPELDLYMDQVTSFMEEQLKDTKRNQEDKVLTKTMINNYAKNDLLPPPVKKKYSKDHMILLIFIYYYKGILSIGDIQTLLKPLTEKYFHTGGESGLSSVYEEVFSLENDEIVDLKDSIIRKFNISRNTFKDAPPEDQEFLQLFSFISMLSYDVYVKKLLIEKMIDAFHTAASPAEKPGSPEARSKTP